MNQQRKHCSKGKMAISQEPSSRKQSKVGAVRKGKNPTVSGSLTSTTKCAVLLVAALLSFGLPLGCSLLEKVNAKERVASALASASQSDGIAAVSNRIEKLVLDGTLSRKQADRLHGIARTAFDQLIEHMKEEFLKEEPETEQ